MGSNRTRTSIGPGTRSPREVADLATRRAILDAAARAFVRNGYGATTVRAIAAQAGLAASSLYNYFRGRDEIFTALRQDCHAEVLAQLQHPMPEGLSFEQRLELLMMRQCEMIEARLESFIYLAHMGGACVDATQPTGQLEYVDQMVEWISSNATQADLGEHSPEDVAYFLFGVHHGSFAQWLRGGAADPLRDQIPKILRLLMRGLS